MLRIRNKEDFFLDAEARPRPHKRRLFLLHDWSRPTDPTLATQVHQHRQPPSNMTRAISNPESSAAACGQFPPREKLRRLAKQGVDVKDQTTFTTHEISEIVRLKDEEDMGFFLIASLMDKDEKAIGRVYYQRAQELERLEEETQRAVHQSPNPQESIVSKELSDTPVNRTSLFPTRGNTVDAAGLLGGPASPASSSSLSVISTPKSSVNLSRCASVSSETVDLTRPSFDTPGLQAELRDKLSAAQNWPKKRGSSAGAEGYPGRRKRPFKRVASETDINQDDVPRVTPSCKGSQGGIAEEILPAPTETHLPTPVESEGSTLLDREISHKGTKDPTSAESQEIRLILAGIISLTNKTIHWGKVTAQFTLYLVERLGTLLPLQANGIWTREGDYISLTVLE
ncbi:hypothetical protein DRE_06743 [Drechslerella stenobrocha 248]|uniref:Uncharacterized protein n=1 Tax=Drechslerella stenobrocha 248 TaxID=1043628 RepID=W7I6P4_9PEZI|nr:hypothetical protein DRE_06743 [Drechslerella stenobrocha 248]